MVYVQCLIKICIFQQHTHYYVRIARFMPRVEIVQKHNTAARRLYIRGHNGKVRNNSTHTHTHTHIHTILQPDGSTSEDTMAR